MTRIALAGLVAPDLGAWTCGDCELTSLADNRVGRSPSTGEPTNRPMTGHRSQTR